MASIYKGQEIINKTADDPDLFNIEKSAAKGVSDTVLDLSCCAYNRFEDCANSFITKECGAEAVDAMNEFTTKTFRRRNEHDLSTGDVQPQGEAVYRCLATDRNRSQDSDALQ